MYFEEESWIWSQVAISLSCKEDDLSIFFFVILSPLLFKIFFL